MAWYNETQAQAQRIIDREDRITTWVLQNLRPGMRVRFAGSRSNKGSAYWREVLEVVQLDRFAEAVYKNPDYVSFEADISFRPYGENREKYYEEYNRQQAEFRKIHPDDRSFIKIPRTVAQVKVVSKNVSANPRPHESVIVAENQAESLSEVFIDDKWVKAKDLK